MDNPSPSVETDPQSFTDTAGRPWRIRLNVGLCRRIRNSLAFDFLAPDERSLQRLLTDDNFLCDLLWILLEEQTAAANVSREEFEAAVDRFVIDRALDALAETLVNFSRPAVRPAMKNLLQAVEQSMEEAGRLAAERMTGPKAAALKKRALHKLGEQMDRHLEKAGGPPSLSLPDSPASTRSY